MEPNLIFQKMILMARVENVSTRGRSLRRGKRWKLVGRSRGEEGGVYEDIKKENGWDNDSGWGKGQSLCSTGKWLDALRFLYPDIEKGPSDPNFFLSPRKEILSMRGRLGREIWGARRHFLHDTNTLVTLCVQQSFRLYIDESPHWKNLEKPRQSHMIC